MDKLGVWILPGAVVLIVAFGLVRRVPVFDAFLQGAKEGLSSSISILPTLVGLMMGVTMLGASGALDMVSSFLGPWVEKLGFPAQALPLALLRPFSGSGSSALAASLFETVHPDSFAGRGDLRAHGEQRNHLLRHCGVLRGSGHQKDPLDHSCRPHRGCGLYGGFSSGGTAVVSPARSIKQGRGNGK